MLINTIKQFYELMFQTRDVRRKIINEYLNNLEPKLEDIEKLKKAFRSLQDIPRENSKFVLKHQQDKKIYVNPDYEIEELKKDIKYLTSSNKHFLNYLKDLHENFSNNVTQGMDFLGNIEFENFISDRDGTVNNYCGRYNSSIQSVYNAVFLIDFIGKMERGIILTSAPLSDTGFLDVNIIPTGFYVFAGSKGREFIWNNKRYELDIDPASQKNLNQLNDELKKLIDKNEYEIFSLIGSGLQFKFGQTTIARQDIYNSIPQEKSKKFMVDVVDIVRKIDPDEEYFAIVDTKKDLEIVLKNRNNADQKKDFDKGDGIKFITDELSVDITKGNNIICGDTESDLAILDYAMSKTKNNYTIFVTKDSSLKQKVKDLCSNALFVDSPDELITILYKYSIERTL